MKLTQYKFNISKGEFIMSMPVITPSTTSLAQAINDVVESVALEQAALSHILNAEGEKIQKFVNDPTLEVSVEDLLTVNKSVQSTLDSITRLEMTLKAKLELFSSYIKG